MAMRSVLTAVDALGMIIRELSSQRRAVLFSDETTPPAAGHRSSQAMSAPFWRHGRAVAADVQDGMMPLCTDTGLTSAARS